MLHPISRICLLWSVKYTRSCDTKRCLILNGLVDSDTKQRLTLIWFVECDTVLALNFAPVLVRTISPHINHDETYYKGGISTRMFP